MRIARLAASPLVLAAGLALSAPVPAGANAAVAAASAVVQDVPVVRDTAAATTAVPPGRSIVVASKPFGESFLLAEMFAQLLEARGFAVDRRPGLGATEIAFQAVRTGSVDVYPEYTGTGLVAILGLEPDADARRVFDIVSTAFRDRWGARWLPPLGFENTYAIAVRRATADSLGLATLTDLAAAAPRLVAGLSPDFIGRDDGLPGLAAAYGLEFGQVRSLLQAVKYQALAERAVDVIDGYSTDGLIDRFDLVVLEDDRRFFPAYEAAPLVGRDLATNRPAAIAALAELGGRLDVERMRALNRRIEVDRVPVEEVAADALADLGLIRDPATTTGGRTTDEPGLIEYLVARRATLAALTLEHLVLVGISLLFAILVAVPIGLALERTAAAESVIRAVGLLQVVPGIALLAFMIPLLGIGARPALVALFLYALYPIVRNTYSGVRNAGPEAVRASEAIGMTPGQTLRYVRLPLAAPVIMAGIRTAAVINVGTATLAAFIGAGGLGEPIVSGLALSDTRMILSGAIPAAILALIVDGGLGLLERAVSPRT
jgi:osmoprotectant transport system permease protein